MSSVLLGLLLACSGGSTTPAPAADLTSCGEGELLDGAVCVPEACGVGPWGDIALADDTVFVNAGSPSGGDGSEASPMRSLQEAVDLAADTNATHVAVGSGTYGGLIMGDADKGLEIAGRCSELVTIDGQGVADAPAVQIIGARKTPDVTLQGVQVSGGTAGGVVVEDAILVLHDARVTGNEALGIGVFGLAEASLERVEIVSNLPNATGETGFGLVVQYGAKVAGSEVTVDDNADVGVLVVFPGSSVELEDCVIARTASSGEGKRGYGVNVQEGAYAGLTRCSIVENSTTGVRVDAAVVDIDECEISRSVANGDGTAGVYAGGGSSVTVHDSLLEGNASGGIVATADGTVVVVEDTEVRGGVVNVDGTGGYGLSAQEGASLTARRCTVVGNTDVGVSGNDATTTVTLEECVITDTESDANGSGGFGIEAQLGATISVLDSTLRGNRSAGVAVWEAGSFVNREGTSVLDTLALDSSVGGLGVQAALGGRLLASGCTISGNTGVGVLASDPGSYVELEDTVVTGTLQGRNTAFGVGMIAQSTATIEGSGVVVSSNEGPGLFVNAAGAIVCTDCELVGNRFAGVLVADGSIALSDATITETLGDPGSGGGFGVYTTSLFGPPMMTLLDSTVGPHPYAALWLDGNGTFDIERNALSGSSGTGGSQPLHGNAVFAENGVAAWSGSSGLLLADNSLSGAGMIAVLLDASTGTLQGNSWEANMQDVVQQRCDGVGALTEADLLAVPSAEICPAGNTLIAYDLAFETLYLPSVETEP